MNEWQKKWLRGHGYNEVAAKEIENHQNVILGAKKKEMKTPEQLKDYRNDYYQNHKEQAYQNYRRWCQEHPEEKRAIQKRWFDAHPHYYRDYMRKRKAVTEPLIFQFLDNCFSGDINGYITYLQNKGIPEQHVKWFKTDVKKHLGET